MAAYRDLIRESFEKHPVRTVAEACDRIFQLTGSCGAAPAKCASSSRTWA